MNTSIGPAANPADTAAGTRKILLAEDEAIIALAEERLLRSSGYEVVSVRSGERAVEEIENDAGRSYDLVLMDIDMGRGMDGTEAARKILELREMPIVFLTSHSEREMVERVRGITRYGYVIKNSGSFVLLSSINMAFELFAEHERTLRSERALRERVLALTRPLDAGTEIAFDELFDPEELQRIQDTFSEVAGVASIITAPDGTPLTRPSNFTRLCFGIIRKTEQGLRNCYKSDAALGAYDPAGPRVMQCLSCGLWDAGAAITVDGRHVANWLIGQVRNEGTDRDRAIRYAREIGADPDDFLAAFEEVPVMALSDFQRIARALQVFANELSTKAYQNVLQARQMARNLEN